MNKILTLLLLTLSLIKVYAQELNAQFVVNADLVNQTNQQIFETLERSLNEFINSQSWSSQEFFPQEKITPGEGTTDQLERLVASQAVRQLGNQEARKAGSKRASKADPCWPNLL